MNVLDHPDDRYPVVIPSPRIESLDPLPDRIFLALVHGVRELARDALEATRRPPLTEMVPDILLWITATIRGAGAAAEELAELQPVRRARAR